MIKWLLCSIS